MLSPHITVTIIVALKREWCYVLHFYTDLNTTATNPQSTEHNTVTTFTNHQNGHPLDGFTFT